MINEENLNKIPHPCALRLQAIYPALKSAEKRAADFILAKPEDVINLNVVDYAQAAECSEATVVRLAKRLGYEGYPELRRAFAAQQSSRSDWLYPEISNADGSEQIVEKVFRSSSAALHDTLEMLNLDSFDQAVKAVSNSNQILFCGIGDASTVAHEAYLRWLRIGHLAYYAQDVDEQLLFASRLQKNDVFLAFSHSGHSRTVINAGKVAKKSGATIITITNFPVSPLAKISDIILQTAVFTTFANFEVVAKRMTQLCIVESLYISFLQKMGTAHIQRLNSSYDCIKANKL